MTSCCRSATPWFTANFLTIEGKAPHALVFRNKNGEQLTDPKRYVTPAGEPALEIGPASGPIGPLATAEAPRPERAVDFDSVAATVDAIWMARHKHLMSLDQKRMVVKFEAGHPVDPPPDVTDGHDSGGPIGPLESPTPENPASAVRPTSFDEVVGQEAAVQSLRLAVEAAKASGEMPEHVLLTGRPGLGKTTLVARVRAGSRRPAPRRRRDDARQPADARRPPRRRSRRRRDLPGRDPRAAAAHRGVPLRRARGPRDRAAVLRRPADQAGPVRDPEGDVRRRDDGSGPAARAARGAVPGVRGARALRRGGSRRDRAAGPRRGAGSPWMARPPRSSRAPRAAAPGRRSISSWPCGGCCAPRGRASASAADARAALAAARIDERGLGSVHRRILAVLARHRRPMAVRRLARAAGLTLDSFRKLYEPVLFELGAIVPTARGMALG